MSAQVCGQAWAWRAVSHRVHWSGVRTDAGKRYAEEVAAFTRIEAATHHVKVGADAGSDIREVYRWMP